jgi:CBS domain-containing protein
MKVRDVMRTRPSRCSPAMNLASASDILSRSRCGALPVVDVRGHVVGVVTDRDICVAVGRQDRRPSEVAVQETMTQPAFTCKAGDEIHAALKTMREHKVRRLPVVGDSGELEGILSLSDLILEARHDDGSRPELTYEDVVPVLRSIYWVHSVSCGTEDTAA